MHIVTLIWNGKSNRKKLLCIVLWIKSKKSISDSYLFLILRKVTFKADTCLKFLIGLNILLHGGLSNMLS